MITTDIEDRRQESIINELSSFNLPMYPRIVHKDYRDIIVDELDRIINECNHLKGLYMNLEEQD